MVFDVEQQCDLSAQSVTMSDRSSHSTMMRNCTAHTTYQTGKAKLRQEELEMDAGQDKRLRSS